MADQNKASHSIPYAKAQGFSHLVGSPQPGVIVQYFKTVMVTGGVFSFANLQMKTPFGTDYTALVVDETSGAVTAVTAAHKSATGITASGPTAGDAITVIVIGRLHDPFAKG